MAPTRVPKPAGWVHGALLVADDEAPVRDVMTALLEDLGFTVLGAADGAEALDLVRRHGQTLRAVLLDFAMPGMDAPAFMAALRGIPSNLPVILTSGRTARELRERAAKLGCAGFVRKPFRAQELFAVLERELSEPPGREQRP